jgi:hypothetical protein
MPRMDYSKRAQHSMKRKKKTEKKKVFFFPLTLSVDKEVIGSPVQCYKI